jgi:methylated-DNA-[protein]-cysteine S-methyltransferase
MATDRLRAAKPGTVHTASRIVSHPVLGGFRLEARPEGLSSVRFVSAEEAARGEGDEGPRNSEASDWLERSAAQLIEYLLGDRSVFELPLVLEGTPFQRKVWETLLEIPHGQTVSYGRLSKAIGMPTAMRAVAGACGRNPVVLVVPCHRVIAADGGIGGFGGGVWRKKWLLEKENPAAGPMF